MLRHSKTSTARDEHELDALDEQLLAAVDAGLPKELVLSALPCGRAEALDRLLRLVTLGIVEDDAAPVRAEPGRYEDDDPFDDQPTGLIEAPEPTRSGVRSPVEVSRNDPAGATPSAAPALDDVDRVILSQADALLARVAGWTLYELLNVPVDASRDTIRTAYATLARRFHPEAFQDKPIGAYRQKLELILATLTRAYGVLYDDQKRALYDAQIGCAKAPVPSAPARVSAVFSRSAAPPVRSKPPVPSVYGTGREQSKSLPAPETVRQVSMAPQRTSQAPATPRASAAPSRPPVEVRSSTPPGASSAESLLRDVRAKRAATVSNPPQAVRASLPPNRSYESPLEALAHELAGGDPTARWAASGLREAHLLERRGELGSALALLQVIVSRYGDPRVREQRDRLQDITRKASSAKSRELAVAAQQNKNYAEAAEHWRAVSDADRKDSKSALEAAVCYMQARELKAAGQYAKRAVELAPNSVLARRVLLRFYETMGMELNAARERQALAKLSGG